MLNHSVNRWTLSYWIEDALIATIIGFVYMIILEEFYKNQNIDAP